MIKNGDMVMVVGSACRHSDADLGKVFVVSLIEPLVQAQCYECPYVTRPGPHAGSAAFHHCVKPVGWLRKIDGGGLLDADERGVGLSGPVEADVLTRSKQGA